jgi:hypothetical protein
VKHPIQKIVKVDNVDRFTENSLVRHLVDSYPNGLNGLCITRHEKGFDKADWDQLMMLIGYSVSAAPISHDILDVADIMVDEELTEEQAKIKHYEQLIAKLREALREPMADLFQKHPDDLDVEER